MSYTVPTLDEIVQRAMDRHRSELPGTDAFLWPNTEHVFLKAVGGAVAMNYEYLGWIKKQRFVTEADGDELDEHGKQWAMPRKPATAAHGKVVFTATPGITIPQGTTLIRSDGVRYSVSTTTVIDNDGTTDVPVTAVLAGADGNALAGTPLSIEFSGLAVSDVRVDDIGIGAGADVETDEDYRLRLLHRQQNTPMGGNESDYVRWVGMVPGATRVWCEALAYGPGTVAVWFMSDGSTLNGIPSQVLIDDVTAYVNQFRPSGARVVIQAPKPAAFEVRVNGIRPASGMQERIDAEIRNVFRRLVDVSKFGTPFTLRNAVLWQAVARITGDATHTITAPPDTTLPPGYIPVLKTICYIS